MSHRYDDSLDDFLAKLRPRRMVTLKCPDCAARFTGKTKKHAQELLLIHQEGTCQGGGEQK